MNPQQMNPNNMNMQMPQMAGASQMPNMMGTPQMSSMPQMPPVQQQMPQGVFQQIPQPQMAPQGQPNGTQVLMPNQMPVQQNPSAASLGSAAIRARQITPVSPNREVPNSTQASLLFSELRDNVVIMKDGSFRAVIACKSINFDLMSELEREGVEYSFQNFLNSLKFSIQILVRSQRVDIGPYLERLSEIRRNNDNMLLGVLMDDYINFVDILSQEANIMDKSFFIVVPYFISEDSEKSLQQTKSIFKSFSKTKGTEVTKIDRLIYEKALSELSNRVDSVMSGLFQIDIQSVRLNTRELAELYYNYNNPDTAVREPLVDFSKLATIYVKKGENNGQE